MADAFFDFDSSLKNGDHLLPPDEDDCIENEEEYDALNDETFGGFEDAGSLDDWEQQHEQFAEIAEISKQNEQIENSLSLLVLDDDYPISLTKSPNVWAYTSPNKNGESLILSSLQKVSKLFIENHIDVSKFSPTLNHIESTSTCDQPKTICTVEELEKNLIKSTNNVPSPQQNVSHNFLSNHMGAGHFHPLLQHSPLQNQRPPPGLPPMNMPPPIRRQMGGPPPSMNHLHHPNLPPGLIRMGPPHHPPPYLGPNGQLLPPPRHPGPPGPPGPPGLMYPSHGNYPMNHPFNFPPPNSRNGPQIPRNHPHLYQHNNHHSHHQNHRQRNDSGSYRQKENQHPFEFTMKDEYAGLMTAREKQWLLNIQMLQLNTGTPYFDDYYYTVFKERKAKNQEINANGRGGRFPNRQRNNDRQEQTNTLTPRVYTPLQFENSLGKLQCGSVTAPRKIIDMDIVTPDKDSDSPQVSRDTRKTKQLLLELEALYAFLLKAEDLKNPLAISNMDKLREIKQKQRLRELELAPTPEQKQEILKIFKQESEPIVENQMDYIVKIVNGLLQEDKFSNFLNIRKGKMLLLRTLPHLTVDVFKNQLQEIWTKVLSSLPITGRRDTSGDNIFPKLHPSFKKYVRSTTMSDILDMVTGLVEVIRQENSRSTPLSHQGKSPLYFVLLNKFGVSALVILLIRTEYLITTNAATEKQQNDWSNFLVSWSDQSAIVTKIAVPEEPIPTQVFTKHCNRFTNLTHEKETLLEKYFVEN